MTKSLPSLYSLGVFSGRELEGRTDGWRLGFRKAFRKFAGSVSLSVSGAFLKCSGSFPKVFREVPETWRHSPVPLPYSRSKNRVALNETPLQRLLLSFSRRLLSISQRLLGPLIYEPAPSQRSFKTERRPLFAKENLFFRVHLRIRRLGTRSSEFGFCPLGAVTQKLRRALSLGHTYAITRDRLKTG